ncbi:hypothetical protein OPT61_g6421 [Boeremia exigua]|uniref:Uncharacterized protein n=1 Tax=Boeremia exigua TaxID=749465 RepID=A0ACC2I6V1_9PLEO|nr:hypothetical protein OPT61_g6421 [Boeremia exigua]
MRLQGQTNLDIDVGYLEYWESSCTQQHGNICKPLPMEDRQPHSIPHWVIDTVKGCLVPGNSVSRYIALSYVWHSANESANLSATERLMLTEESFFEFQKPGFLRDILAKRLPHAIKDAIVLVQRYGERYLWVDCLCIVQNSQAKLDQIDNMGEIYSGAHFTILAATTSGRLNTEKYSRRHSTYQTEPGFELYDKLFKSKWASRGWTFQEHMLSKRAIIFLDGLTFWSCQKCAWDRDNLTPSNSSSSEFVRLYHETAQRLLSNQQPNFSTYIEVITLYNCRDLTYPQDALPAISGVLSTLARSFHGGFISGLPCETLDVALLWQPFSVARRRVAEEGENIAIRSHLPSWSWCGWQCPIDPFYLRSRVDFVERDTAKVYTATWQTHKLVTWYALSEDMKQSWCVEMANTSSTRKTPIAYASHVDSGKERPIQKDSHCFGQKEVQDIKCADASDTAASCESLGRSSSISQHHRIYPFLTCTTTVASLCIRKVFRWQQYDWGEDGPPVGAVFHKPLLELLQFNQIPKPSEMCHLICLGDSTGRPAGVLRRMNSDPAEPGDLIKLVAISTGTVEKKDLQSYHGDRGPLQHELMQSDIDKTWTTEESELLKEVENYGTEGSSGWEYHFYNVLWVECKNGIMYRRAAGRVPKVIWEENCTEPTKIVLG